MTLELSDRFGNDWADWLRSGAAKAFNPNQLRDQLGRWSDTGAGGGSYWSKVGGANLSLPPPFNMKGGEFARRMTAGLDDLGVKPENVSVGLFTTTHGNAGVHLSIHDAAAGIGMTRTIGDNYAAHNGLVLDAKLQAHGIAKRLLSSQIELYKELGINRIRMIADSTVGGYAWAKYGFVPASDDLGAVKWFVTNRHAQLGGQSNPDVEAFMASTDPKAVWRLADSPSGKSMLIGSTYSAGLDLTDAEAMKRFNAYVS